MDANVRAQTTGIAMRYVAGAYGGSWACWLAAGALCSTSLPCAQTLQGALLLAGTMAPMVTVYVLFPQMRAAGLPPRRMAPQLQGDQASTDLREGFWSFVFGGAPTVRGLTCFVLLALWRWAMFFCAFGFPESLPDAASSFFGGLPALLLGGGFEEVGWRGCLEPALERALGRRRLAAPLATGCIWAAWHLPLFIIPGTFQSQIPLWSVFVVGIALSCSFAALYRATQSVGACVAHHAWYNAMLVAIPSFGPLACTLFVIEAVAGLLAIGLLMREEKPGGPR